MRAPIAAKRPSLCRWQLLLTMLSVLTRHVRRQQPTGLVTMVARDEETRAAVAAAAARVVARAAAALSGKPA